MKTIVIGTIIKSDTRVGGGKPDDFVEYGCIKELTADSETALVEQFRAFAGANPVYHESIGMYIASRLESESNEAATDAEICAWGDGAIPLFYADYYMTVTKRFEE